MKNTTNYRLTRAAAFLLALVLCLALFGCSSSEAESSRPTVVGTNLFETVYVPFASGDENGHYSMVIDYLEQTGFDIVWGSPAKENDGDNHNEFIVTDPASDGDYVYFFFKGQKGYEFSSITYYRKELDTEVTMSNFSTDHSPVNNQYTIHKIGSAIQKGYSVAIQRKYLFEQSE